MKALRVARLFPLAACAACAACASPRALPPRTAMPLRAPQAQAPAAPAAVAAPRPAPPPLPSSAIPPGVDADRARLAASLCAAAYDPQRKTVGCRSHPPFEADEQRPDGTLPPWTGDPQGLCEIADFVRGAFTSAGKDEALVVFSSCLDKNVTWDMANPGSALLVEQRDGRWQPTSYVPDVNLDACLKDHKKDGRDVLLCRSNLMTGVTGSVYYWFVVDLAHGGARTLARVFSHDELCTTLADPSALDRGYTRLTPTSTTLADRNQDGALDLVVKVRRAHVAAASDLAPRARKACAVNATRPAIVPAGAESTLDFLDDGERFFASPATKALLDRWEQESPERFNGLREVGPPNAPTSCAFPPVSPSEGTTAEQCCAPAAGVELCLATMSLLGHHEVGPYTQRVLTVRARGRADRSFPLDRQGHFSMAHPDSVFARLSFEARESGLELRVREGCAGLCSGERCSGEQKRIATLCASAGAYGWDGERAAR